MFPTTYSTKRPNVVTALIESPVGVRIDAVTVDAAAGDFMCLHRYRSVG